MCPPTIEGEGSWQPDERHVVDDQVGVVGFVHRQVGRENGYLTRLLYLQVMGSSDDFGLFSSGEAILLLLLGLVLV